MFKNLTMAVVGFGIAAFFTQCTKPKSTNLSINLTSTPSSYEAVNVTIKEVWVRVSKENTGWFFLKTVNQTFDLNQLANGKIAALVASGPVPLSDMKEVRFVLGEGNSVRKSGKDYPLELNSKLDGGAFVLYLKRPLTNDQENIVFEMDSKTSVSVTTDNRFVFDPQVRMMQP